VYILVYYKRLLADKAANRLATLLNTWRSPRAKCSFRARSRESGLLRDSLGQQLGDPHFSDEAVLVGADIATPLGDCMLVTDPDLLGHLVDQAEVVTHEDQSTLKAVDGLGQRIDTLHIQMVRGLPNRVSCCWVSL